MSSKMDFDWPTLSQMSTWMHGGSCIDEQPSSVLHTRNWNKFLKMKKWLILKKERALSRLNNKYMLSLHTLEEKTLTTIKKLFKYITLLWSKLFFYFSSIILSSGLLPNPFLQLFFFFFTCLLRLYLLKQIELFC